MNMKPLITSLLFISLFSPSLYAQLEVYPFFGKVSSLSQDSITVMDTRLRISPTVKAFTASGKPISLDKIRPGMKVGVRTIRIGNKLLVDSIHLLK